MISEKHKTELPREKLVKHGAQTLSLNELMAILLRTGTKEKDVLTLCDELLKRYNFDLIEISRLNVIELSKIKGIGMTKATTLLAALELGYRRCNSNQPKKEKVNSSAIAYNAIRWLFADKTHEEFWILLLNRSNHIIGKELIAIGGIEKVAVDLKLIFNKTLLNKACNIILTHNHPSGNTQPSKSDISITNKIIEAGKLLDINILDHLIIGNNEYLSFKDQNLI